MVEHFGESFKRKMIDNRILPSDRIEGCTPDDIQAVMQAQKVTHLPKIFREYLESMGRKGLGYNPYLGASWSCNALKLLKNWMQGSLKDHPETGFELPADAFVFFDKGGDIYRYFLTADKAEDPPIYEVRISNKSQHRSHESLSEYFGQLLQHYLRHNHMDFQTKPLKPRKSRLSESSSRRNAFLKGLVNQIFGDPPEDNKPDKD